MFKKLFGKSEEKSPPPSRLGISSVSELSIPGVVVKNVVPFTPETQGIIVPLLLSKTAIPANDANLRALKTASLKDSYHRAGGSDAALNMDDKNRASLWYRVDGNGQPNPDTMIKLHELKAETSSGSAFQPTIVLGGKNALFAMVFEPPCCENADSVLVCYKQGGNFGYKVVMTEAALVADVAGAFRRSVHVGLASTVEENLGLSELRMHLDGIAHDCAKGFQFPAGYK